MILVGFSPANTPHLFPALEIDDAMVEFSGSLSSRGLPTTVNSSSDLDVLINAFQEHLKSVNLWQYYVLNVDTERQSVKDAITANNVTPWTSPDIAHKTVVELADIARESGIIKGYRSLGKRFGTYVPGPVAAGLVKAAFIDLGDNADALADAWIRVVDVINVPLYQEWEEDTKIALDQIKGRLKYTRLDVHGPKLGPITKE